jgi:hypothetical protein
MDFFFHVATGFLAEKWASSEALSAWRGDTLSDKSAHGALCA